MGVLSKHVAAEQCITHAKKLAASKSGQLRGEGAVIPHTNLINWPEVGVATLPAGAHILPVTTLVDGNLKTGILVETAENKQVHLSPCQERKADNELACLETPWFHAQHSAVAAHARLSNTLLLTFPVLTALHFTCSSLLCPATQNTQLQPHS
jgi:hypothetical protein